MYTPENKKKHKYAAKSESAPKKTNLILSADRVLGTMFSNLKNFARCVHRFESNEEDINGVNVYFEKFDVTIHIDNITKSD